MKERTARRTDRPSGAVGAAGPVAERRCPRCGVRLSSYNPGPNCWQHTTGWPWRGPSARPKFR
ncbi:MAG TPA: hypothetical protein VNO34_11430 [Actinomycetota bacterium]|nr:hypothetical protein [Actinomycetota bacterium]